MIAECPNNMNHTQFITVAHIAQDWVVDKNGYFLEVHEDSLETVAPPNTGNTWTCKECGAEAMVGEISLYEKSLEKVIAGCKEEWSRWALDERDSGINIPEMINKPFGRPLTEDELQREDIRKLIKWAASVCEIGNNLAYQNRVSDSQEVIGKCKDEWRVAKNSDPDL